MYRKKYVPLHIKPLVFKNENLLELPLSLQQILARHPYPLAQGPALLGQLGGLKTTSKLASI